jgi:hypothetical protein
MSNVIFKLTFRSGGKGDQDLLKDGDQRRVRFDKKTGKPIVETERKDKPESVSIPLL